MEEYFRKDHQKKEAVKKTLKEYVDKCPIEYQEAINYTKVEKSLKIGGMSLPKQIIRQPGPDLP